ncbi:LamG-like jellyroll fold domain-containing protein [Paenibacillus guangzhouensis]|uniref:LamG-like jellyroll fold domain-containing protein n=1 Tax=Paenibacillus guangzhouensis TaxID=1473112 RepID=UPI001266F66C|nr:LamG-like jellyroll fold domain-containing protein [Paenibacillus guangzhouensis]
MVHWDDEVIGNENPRWQVTYEHAEAARGEGIHGQALDFSMNAAIRRSIARQNPLRAHAGDFTVSVWVKGDPLLEFGHRSYDIVSATYTEDVREIGWKLSVQPSGAWSWRILGEESHVYEPTAARQSIRDGAWHLLVFTYSSRQPEIRLYYDGLNVGIYSVSLPPTGAWNRADTLWIGGEPQNDCDRETFPGWIDEVWMDDRALTADEIRERYRKCGAVEPALALAEDVSSLKVMTFNIWNGGREMGAQIGVQRVIDVIRDSGADVITMQETYGSGPIIADALGYYFYLRSSNLSIMSRYPIGDTYPYYQAFHCGGARLQLSEDLHVNVFSIWLHYLADYWGELYRDAGRSQSQLFEGEQERMKELAEIMKALAPLAAKSEQEPLLLCGDFNSGSHLDWIEATRSLHNGYVFPFPQSIALAEAGYRDTYRKVHPDPMADPCVTWPAEEQGGCIGDRIDYIYAHGTKLQPQAAQKINTHEVRYPSDHAAVMVAFEIR